MEWDGMPLRVCGSFRKRFIPVEFDRDPLLWSDHALVFSGDGRNADVVRWKMGIETPGEISVNVDLSSSCKR